MELIINEPYFQLNNAAARRVGLNEGLLLQRLHELLVESQERYEDNEWVSRSYKQWHEEFSFWSVDTIIRGLKKLQEHGYVISSREYRKEKSYRIHYEKCESHGIVFYQSAR